MGKPMDQVTYEEGMFELGLRLEPDGRWVSENGGKEIIDFVSGITVTSHIYDDAPEFDITTVHAGTERTGQFLHDAIMGHIEEIDRRTKLILAGGLPAIKRPPSS